MHEAFRLVTLMLPGVPKAIFSLHLVVWQKFVPVIQQKREQRMSASDQIFSDHTCQQTDPLTWSARWQSTRFRVGREPKCWFSHSKHSIRLDQLIGRWMHTQRSDNPQTSAQVIS